MIRLRENYTESFTDQTREILSGKLQTTFQKTGLGQRGGPDRGKSLLGLKDIVDEFEMAEREQN